MAAKQPVGFDPKTLMYLAIFVAIMVVSIYFVQQTGIFPQGNVQLPNDINPEAGPDGSFNPHPYTDSLYNDINSYGIRDVSAYSNALQLSNAELAAVINDWNARYYNKSQQKLSDAISGEFFSFFDFSFRDVRDQLVARLHKLESLPIA